MKNSIVQYAINKKRKQVGKRGRMFTAAAGALMLGAMSLLTACSSGTSSGTQSGTGAASQSAESGAPGGQAAKGRYMEEEIALPEEIAENGYVGVVLSPMKRGMTNSTAMMRPPPGQKARL